MSAPRFENIDPRLPTDRETLVVDNLSLADSLARRYAGRGQDVDDLIQVARLGLVHAARRYRPGHGSFASFAVPTITGELKRHFRDHGWLVRPPRRTQELQSEIEQTWSDLSQELGRDPGIAEITDRLELDHTMIATAMTARSAYHGVSLDHTTANSAVPMSDRIGVEDRGFDRVDLHVTLAAVCQALPPDDRALLHRRFVEERSQNDIATELGTNQMAVSRRLAAIMTELRAALTESASPQRRPRRPHRPRRRTVMAPVRSVAA